MLLLCQLSHIILVQEVWLITSNIITRLYNHCWCEQVWISIPKVSYNAISALCMHCCVIYLSGRFICEKKSGLPHDKSQAILQPRSISFLDYNIYDGVIVSVNVIGKENDICNWVVLLDHINSDMSVQFETLFLIHNEYIWDLQWTYISFPTRERSLLCAFHKCRDSIFDTVMCDQYWGNCIWAW